MGSCGSFARQRGIQINISHLFQTVKVLSPLLMKIFILRSPLLMKIFILNISRGYNNYPNILRHCNFGFRVKKNQQTTFRNIFLTFPRKQRLMLSVSKSLPFSTTTFGLGGAVGCASDWRPGGCGVDPSQGRQHSFVAIDHEIFSTVILSLPLIQEGQLSVSGERICTILGNRLED